MSLSEIMLRRLGADGTGTLNTLAEDDLCSLLYEHGLRSPNGELTFSSLYSPRGFVLLITYPVAHVAALAHRPISEN